MTTTRTVHDIYTRATNAEGRVNHMYLDSRGFVTVGVGHLITTVAAAQMLRFTTDKNRPANKDEIRLDYEAVKKQPANRLAAMYKKHTKLILPQSEIDRLTDLHINSFAGELRIIYPGFDTFPINARLALFDLIFNVGMTDLKNNWPIFNTAIAAKDWRKAANNSNRKPPVSPARNAYVKRLLESCAALPLPTKP